MARNNNITIGCRVKGSHGDFIPNPRGHRRHICAVITGVVVKAVGYGWWIVKWDSNGKEKKCPSRSLNVINNRKGIPVNKPNVNKPNNNNNNIVEKDLIDSTQEPAMNDHDASDIDGEAEIPDKEVPNGDWEVSDELLRGSFESNRHIAKLQKSWKKIFFS